MPWWGVGQAVMVGTSVPLLPLSWPHLLLLLPLSAFKTFWVKGPVSWSPWMGPGRRSWCMVQGEGALEGRELVPLEAPRLVQGPGALFYRLSIRKWNNSP